LIFFLETIGFTKISFIFVSTNTKNTEKMENLANSSMNLEKAKKFLADLCGDSTFGKQVLEECIGTLSTVGYPISKGEFGVRVTTFVNDYNTQSLTNHYKQVLRGYE
jgi:hypothetical protein